MSTVIRFEAAADGARTVEVTWDEGADPSMNDLTGVLRSLGLAGPPQTEAEERAAIDLLSRTWADAKKRTGAAVLVGAAAMRLKPDACRRSLCGHPHAEHGAVDDQGMLFSADEEHGGMCMVCNNPDSCRSFVGGQV